MQLVRDALVAPAEDDHQLPDGHGSVSVPGAGHRPCEGGNPPPVEEAGSRHLPNPRPSAHNAPRATGSTARGEGGHRLQRRAGGPARDPRAPPQARGDVALWCRQDGAPPTGPASSPVACVGCSRRRATSSMKSTLSIFRVGVSHPLSCCHLAVEKSCRSGPGAGSSGRAWGKSVISQEGPAHCRGRALIRQQQLAPRVIRVV